ncbi:Flavin containing amine oxidoreductase [seawater metagenome]|uniref:Flavin containing amine oxidoreductase n=1 Tax=seawater metagenome TaxID=1561972 RepID=A0A5E8CGF6_9ZZZZ
MRKQIYIIGGGVSGLVSACYLKKKGYDVTIIEKNNVSGGRLFEFKEEGFHFNNGPSWYWMKDIFEEVFLDIGISKQEMYWLIKLDPQYKIVFPDKDMIIPGEYSEIRKLFPINERSKLDSFVKESKNKYQISRKYFLRYKNLSIFEYFNWETLFNIFSFNFHLSYRDYCKKFTDNKYLQTLLEWPALFIGSSPKSVSAMYSILSYSMLAEGTYLPAKGMIEIVNLLENHSKKLGVNIKLNESLIDYKIKNNKIINIITDKNIYQDIEDIICSCDYNFNESLLPDNYKTYPNKYWQKLELCPSCILIHLGLNKKLPTKDFHVLFFDNNLDHHLNCIYDQKKLPSEPLFYLNISSKLSLTAPYDCENLFILIPTGPGMIINQKDIEEAYKYVINKLETYYKIKLKDNIIKKKIFKNQDFSSRFNAYQSNAYGLTCHPLQTAFLKPRIMSRYINNLYYCGQLTNPGPGLPPCLLSGIVTSKYLIQNKGQSNRFKIGESLTLILSIFIRTFSFFTTLKVFIKEILYIFFNYLI